MAPGQHPNAHPGAGMVQQVHPGVSAPGGPQVSQGGPVMGGMPPGAGTTGPGSAVQAHALSHLGPAQAHMFQQPHFAQQCMFLRVFSQGDPLSAVVLHGLSSLLFFFFLPGCVVHFLM